MKLDNAYACLDCERLCENSRFCEFCMSYAVWPLKAWLNRTPGVPKDAEVVALEKLYEMPSMRIR